MPRPQLVDSTVLEAALVGLEHKKSELDQQITAVRKLGGRAHQLTVRLCRRPAGGNAAPQPGSDCPSNTAEIGRVAEGEGGKQVTRDLNVSEPRDRQSCYSGTVALLSSSFVEQRSAMHGRTFVTLTSGLRLPRCSAGTLSDPQLGNASLDYRR